MIKNDIKARAHRGPTGNLKRSIKAKPFKRALFVSKYADKAHAFVAIDYRKGRHAHLLEWGTAERFHKSGKSTGSVPKNTFKFFTPVITAWSGQRYLREMQKVLRESLRKQGNKLNTSVFEVI